MTQSIAGWSVESMLIGLAWWLGMIWLVGAVLLTSLGVLVWWGFRSFPVPVIFLRPQARGFLRLDRSNWRNLLPVIVPVAIMGPVVFMVFLALMLPVVLFSTVLLGLSLLSGKSQVRSTFSYRVFRNGWESPPQGNHLGNPQGKPRLPGSGEIIDV